MITLVVGATRGLGNSLAKQYVSQGATVYGTARKPVPDDGSGLNWIPDIDIGTADAADVISKAYKSSSSTPFDLVLVVAGFFGKESFEEPDWKAQETMYKTSAIGPVFLVSGLVKTGLLTKGSKVIMVSSEAGSITLRHISEGGGNFGHHASKAALNMVTKLLSLDLLEKGIAVGAVHPGFMKTEMTRSVGFDKFWEDGGGK
jgi:NAD(P)-dependent dehydrogenase (short-subunit alcohol dehydrogenase family)